MTDSLSFGDLRDRLQKVIFQKYGSPCPTGGWSDPVPWIREDGLTEDTVVFNLGQTTYRQSFKVEGDVPELIGDRQEVERAPTVFVTVNDDIHPPIAQRGVQMMHPDALQVHPSMQYKEGVKDLDNQTTNKTKSYDEYDVDKGGTLLGWQAKDGTPYVADGHHRRKRASIATNFVSSRLKKGGKVAVPRQIPVRMLHEDDGWSFDMVKEFGKQANVAGADGLETISETFETAVDSFTILALDAEDGVLLRVRQKATRANSINRNGRIYPANVLDAAIDEAQPRARAKVMLTEYVHPEIVPTKKGDGFVDNPDRKSGRVDSISKVDAHGWVYIDRSFLDTDKGRVLASLYKQAAAGEKVKLPGISTRFTMKGHRATVDGKPVIVADQIRISTWDDVDVPAVDGAGEFVLLTDAQSEEIESGASLPFSTINGTGFNTANPAVPDDEKDQRPESGRAQDNEMNKTKEDVSRALTALLDKAKAGAPPLEVLGLYDTARDTFEAFAKVDEAGAKAIAPEMAAADMGVSLAGYNASGPKLYAIFAKDMGSGDPNKFAPDMSKKSGDPLIGAAPAVQDPDKLTDSLTPADRKIFEELKTDRANRAKTDDINAKVDELKKSDKYAKLTDEQKEIVFESARKLAGDASAVEGLVESNVMLLSKVVTDNSKKDMGKAAGQTTKDVASPFGAATVNREVPPYMMRVEKLLAIGDELNSLVRGQNKPRLREHNRKALMPMIDHFNATWLASRGNAEEFRARMDAAGDDGEKAFLDSFVGAADTVTSLSTLFNQPEMLLTLLIQSLQDLSSMPFIQTFGPGQQRGDAGWADMGKGFGSVLRIPTEYFTPDNVYGPNAPGNQNTLAVPAGSGIPESSLNLAWASYSAVWRWVGASIQMQAIRALGQGPANYPALGRLLANISAMKDRTIDRLLWDEIYYSAFRKGATLKTGESQTTANNGLVYNSAYLAGGSVKVNLNVSKAAAAAVVAGDQFVTYGTAVKGALRILGPATDPVGGSPAAPYCGTLAGTSPLVAQQIINDLTAAGAAAVTTNYPFTLTLPGAGVQGDYNPLTGNIDSRFGTTATFALDYRNGVIIFASGVTGAAGVMTTTTTYSYYYAAASSYDNVIADYDALTIPTGQSRNDVLGQILDQIDLCGAAMGSYPNFVKPNFGVMTLNAASRYITPASRFYQWESPKGTELFPTEDAFATHNGIDLSRINAPTLIDDTTIIIGREGVTTYGIETPMMMEGPFPSYDSNGLVIPNGKFIGGENSVIATPLPMDQSNNILNYASRAVLLRGRNV